MKNLSFQPCEQGAQIQNFFENTPIRCPLLSRREAAAGVLQKWILMRGGSVFWKETERLPPGAGKKENFGLTLWRRKQKI